MRLGGHGTSAGEPALERGEEGRLPHLPGALHIAGQLLPLIWQDGHLSTKTTLSNDGVCAPGDNSLPVYIPLYDMSVYPIPPDTQLMVFPGHMSHAGQLTAECGLQTPSAMVVGEAISHY